MPILSPSWGSWRGLIIMKKIYIKPVIIVVPQIYNEGLMSTASLPESTISSWGGGLAKPGGEWGSDWGNDDWAEPVVDNEW